MYIINAVSLIGTFHLYEQNFKPMNQRGSDKQGCTVLHFNARAQTLAHVARYIQKTPRTDELYVQRAIFGRTGTTVIKQL